MYGRLSTSAIAEFTTSDPDWFDMLRPSRLPSFENEFGHRGHTWFTVRPTYLGLKPTFPTPLGEVRGTFEWDLAGVGANVGETAFHLFLAYAEIGRFGAGQYFSPFMDFDVFPNSLEYWGPSGMVFYSNVQLRYLARRGDSHLNIAIERPGGSGDRGDGGDGGNRIALANVVGRFPLPDLSADGRLARNWGYVELAGILRPLYWDDLLPDDEFDLDGNTLGWGLSLSSRLNTTKRDRLKLQVTYGEAIQSYMDAPFDVGVENRPGDPVRPFVGVPLPVLSMLSFYDRYWNERYSTSLGYSRVQVQNSDGQNALAFGTGQYALINLLYTLKEELSFGGELQWGRRDNAFDGFSADALRLQLSARFSYSHTLRGDDSANGWK